MRSIWAMMMFLSAFVSASAQDSIPNFTGTWSGTFQVVFVSRDASTEGQVKEMQRGLITTTCGIVEKPQ